MPLAAASGLAPLVLTAWGSTSAGTAAAALMLVVPSPGSPEFDRWDLDYWEWQIGRRR